MKRPHAASQTKPPRKRPAQQDPEPIPPRSLRRITPREQQVLEFVWGGFMNRDISRRLKISIRTVEAHRSSIMLKMGVSNTAQLLRQAIRFGFLEVDGSRLKSMKN